MNFPEIVIATTPGSPLQPAATAWRVLVDGVDWPAVSVEVKTEAGAPALVTLTMYARSITMVEVDE